ncbi:DNA ligase-like domain-containing protein [Streptomyces cellulosae]|uniref:hypothetical protein n=1 Tax=Streptomyces cellulosae TaxID=1968 RepID=UPI0004CACB93|nr:hypothetical protein [Streptomyces cellulosae]
MSVTGCGTTDMGLTRRQAVEASGVAVTYYVFDMVRLEGQDLTRLPLRTRESLPRRALAARSPLRLTPHSNAGGAELRDGMLRDPWFLGPRDDRKPREVVRERAATSV